MPKRPATLRDVAAVVGVSPRTVSRVVNDETGFSEETRAKVMAAVEELGYRPNVLARGLISGRSRTIAFVATVLDDPFFPEVAQAVQRAARAAGLTMLLAVNELDVDLENELLAQLESYAPEGIIVFPATHDAHHLRPIVERGTPMVVVDAGFDHPDVALLRSDLRGAARLAVDRLVERRCRRIVMLANESTTAPVDDRETGFTEAIRAHGLGDANIVQTPATREGGHAALGRALAADERIDGVFAYNDIMAIGALRAAGDAGRSVPGDIAIVGCDDVGLSTLVSPTLTTVKIDRTRLGEEAVRLVTSLADGTRYDEPVVLPVELVVRETA